MLQAVDLQLVHLLVRDGELALTRARDGVARDLYELVEKHRRAEDERAVLVNAGGSAQRLADDSTVKVPSAIAIHDEDGESGELKARTRVHHVDKTNELEVRSAGIKADRGRG